MIRRRPGFTMIEVMVVVGIIAVLIMLLLPAVQSAREAARRAQCVNHLLQFGIAFQNYESTYQVLPPGVVNPTGPIAESPAGYHFNWITQILPFLEQKNVHRRLDFSAGLYSANNLTARGVAINGLNCPSEPRGRGALQNFSAGSSDSRLAGILPPALTSYAACHNDVEAPIDVANTGIFFLNSHVRLDEIEDGQAHTIFVGEKRGPGDELGWASGTRSTLRNTGTPINRTVLEATDMAPFVRSYLYNESPSDINPPDPQAGAPGDPAASTIAAPIKTGGFSSYHSNGANFLFGDGSVRFLRSNLDERIFRLLGNREDGGLVADDQF